jgi:UDP-3-O-acyl-N-acetylglucosamine deacetylase
VRGKDGNPATFNKSNGVIHMSALEVQVSGNHYKKYSIQPVEYIHSNGIPFIEGSIIKYVTRWKDKGGVRDLEKARHFIDLLIELECRKDDGK